ncbi:MAG: folylpolyglutamate synthase/dihydrofolate synthase family protein [Elusimicrobiota bacterium]
MTFARALAVLERRQEAKIVLGLARMRRHLLRLGRPQAKLACFHVAGTNGKGSTCAMLESVLREAGYKTGLYTSPHLFNVRERIRLGGRPIPEKDFARLMVKTTAADPGKELTYFELLTSIAFQYFAEKGAQAVILETGLGGRLDATNVVAKPLATLISSIDFDHMAYLGETLSAIAAEKAGIFKAGVPAFCPGLKPVALKILRARARKLGAPLAVLRKPWKTVAVDYPRNRQVLSDGRRRWTVGLLGSRQGANLALARSALESSPLGVSEAAWRRGLARLRWPGRFEVRRHGAKTLILDGAHNPEAMAELVRTFDASPWGRKPVRWIIGVMKDKDYAGIIRAAAPRLSEVVAVRPPSPRALDSLTLAREIRRQVPRAHVSVESDPRTALRSWLKTPGAPKTAVVCGSFYLVGEVSRA